MPYFPLKVTVNMFNGLRLSVACLICAGVVGCQKTNEIEVAAPSPTHISIELKPLMAPLTEHEVTAFLTIVERLPQGTVPEFSPLQHTPQPQAKSVQEHVGQLQQRFRDSIDVRKQAELWKQDSKLRHAFEQMQVDPVAFSALAARISFAWSALAIGEKLPVATTERTLTSHLYQLMKLAQSPPKGMTQHQRQQMLSALEETVALGEFLQLLKKVPADSVTQIANFREELDHLLPRANSVAAFEKHLVKEPEIIRVGHSQ